MLRRRDRRSLSTAAAPVIEQLEGRRLLAAILSGQTLTGTISGSAETSFEFDASAGDRIIASFGEVGSNNAFSPNLRVVAPDGTELVSNGRTNGGSGISNASTGAITSATLDGEYILFISDGDPTPNGDVVFNLSLAVGSGEPILPDLESGESSGPILSGQTLTGELDNGGLATYTFAAVAGNRITAAFGEQVNNNQFAPFVYVIAPDGDILAQGGGSGGGGSGIAIGNTKAETTASLDGVYTLVAGDLDAAPNAPVGYNLSLGVGSGSSIPADLDGGDTSGPIVNDTAVRGQLGNGGLGVYTFAALEGDRIGARFSETVSDNQFSPLLRIIAPDGIVLASTGGEGGGSGIAVTSATTSVTATSNGIYTLIAADGDPAPSSLVEYEIIINGINSSPPPVENVAPTLGSLTDSPDPATVGDDVTLTATGANDSDGRVVEVRFFRDTDEEGDVPVGVDADGSDGYSAVFSTEDLEPGDYDYYAVVVDDDGALSGRATTTNTVTAVVTPPPVENVPPTLGGLVASPEPVTVGDALTLTATGANDSDGSVAGVEFYRAVAGGPDVLLSSDADGGDGYAASVDTSGLEPGTYTYYAVAVDDDGGRSEQATATNTVVAVVTPPPETGIDFTLLDATADVRLGALSDGDVLTRDMLPSNFSVQANVAGDAADTQSVRFTLAGPGGLSYTNLENTAFYTLFVNQGGDFDGYRNVFGEAFPAGDYTLTATAYAADNAGGAATASESITLTVVGEPARVTGLSLVNAEDDSAVLELTDGLVISQGDVPASASILATTTPATVGSVRLDLRGPVSVNQVEQVAPYTLFANDGGDYFGGSLPAGSYTLIVTPYGGFNASGDVGERLTITFSIVADELG